MARARREFVGPDGTAWRVEARNPGASNLHIVFLHPDPRRTREHRYANHVWKGPESQNITGRIDPAVALESLGDADVALLFRRSMPINGRPSIAGRSL
jgi:hypothetical protein